VAADTGMKLVLLAGTLTFTNEWLQTREINWRVPVAAALAAVGVSAFSHVSPGGATALGVMALIVAAATPLNGKSPIQEFGAFINPPGVGKTKTTRTKATP
jgi:hypothetical protein